MPSTECDAQSEWDQVASNQAFPANLDHLEAEEAESKIEAIICSLPLLYENSEKCESAEASYKDHVEISNFNDATSELKNVKREQNTDVEAATSSSREEESDAYQRNRVDRFSRMFEDIQKKGRYIKDFCVSGTEVDLQSCAFTMMLICILLIMLLPILQAEGQRDSTESPLTNPPIPTFSPRLKEEDEEEHLWNDLFLHLITKPKIEFKVGKTEEVIPNKEGETVKLIMKDELIRVVGKPKFCTETNVDNDESKIFSRVTHVHMTEMHDCNHYTHLILNKWEFPNVRYLKLHKMVIEKEEFIGLSNFIDRHNETIHRLVIDESYLCPSPECDAEMLNFPNNFQVAITRRRERADWI